LYFLTFSFLLVQTDEEQKAKAKERRAKPESKAKDRANRSRPEFKAREKERRQTPVYKAKDRANSNQLVTLNSIIQSV
jgi:hypothetical protein